MTDALNTPDARGMVADLSSVPPDVTGDFVVCLQTIGFNRWFDPEATPVVLQNLIDAVDPGGDAVVQRLL